MVVETKGKRAKGRSRKEMGRKRRKTEEGKKNGSEKSSRRIGDLEEGGGSSKVRGRG